MIIIYGSPAWMIGLFSLILFNFTPFCVGIDNGDGTNKFALCSLYTVAAVVAYSPGIFVMLIICALIGDKSASALLGISIDRQ
jgi:hypothetical protein